MLISLETPFVLISLLEYDVSVWSPPFRYEIDVKESVQRRETNNREFSHVPYELHLEKLKIMDLETSRLGVDLIHNELGKVNWFWANDMLRFNSLTFVH